MVDERYRSSSVGRRFSPNQGKMSTSSIFEMTPEILDRCSSKSSGANCGGIFPNSKLPTKFLLESASPMSLSRTSGGQVAIRSIGKMPGFALMVAGSIRVRSVVRVSPCERT